MTDHDELLTRADEAYRLMFDQPVTMEEALQAAADFLAGLIEHADFYGYMDPNAGEVSSHFVLMMVRAALAARPQPVFEGTVRELIVHGAWRLEERQRVVVYPAVAGSVTPTGDDVPVSDGT